MGHFERWAIITLSTDENGDKVQRSSALTKRNKFCGKKVDIAEQCAAVTDGDNGHKQRRKTSGSKSLAVKKREVSAEVHQGVGGVGYP